MIEELGRGEKPAKRAGRTIGLAVAVAGSLGLSGCAGMTAEQQSALITGGLLGLLVLGVASQGDGGCTGMCY
jgi:hypothetical protein